MSGRTRKKRKREWLPDDEYTLAPGKGHDPFVPILGVSWCPSCIKQKGRWVCPQNKVMCVYKQPIIVGVENVVRADGKAAEKPKRIRKPRMAVATRKRRDGARDRSMRMRAVQFAVYRQKALREMRRGR
jgi:hypothetical protein